MSTENPSHRDVRLPVDLESLTWDAQAQLLAVRARLADVNVLAEAMTDPRVGRRVVIDQAVDLRRSLLDQAEQARRTLGGRGSTQRRLRRDDRHEQATLATRETLPQAHTVDAVLTAALTASAGAARPLAVALVDQADLEEVGVRSVATCRRFLFLADHLITRTDTRPADRPEAHDHGAFPEVVNSSVRPGPHLSQVRR